MKKTMVMIMAFTILTQITGFVKDIVLANYFGVSHITDAFIISMTIPTTLFALIGAGIRAAYIPIYQEIKDKSGDTTAIDYTNRVLNLIFCFSLVIAAFTFIFPEFVIFVFASGFEGETLQLAVKLTRISIIAVFMSGFIQVLIGFLQVNRNFIIPSLIGIPMNLIITFFIIYSFENNSIYLAIGYLLAVFSQCIFVLITSLIYKFRYKLTISIKDEHINKFLIIAFPIFLSSAVSDINKMIDKNIASNLLEGSVSALNYSAKLTFFIQAIFVAAITTAIFPLLSKMVVRKNYNQFKDTILESVIISLLIILPITLGTMVLSRDIITVLYGRGAFSDYAINLTSNALLFYAIGMLPRGLKQIYNRGFYAFKNTRIPMMNSLIAISINIILNLLIYFYTDMGVRGIALSTSLSLIISSTMLIYHFNRKLLVIDYSKITIDILKIIFASLTMISVTIFLKSNINYIIANSFLILIQGQDIIVLLLIIAPSAICYIILILLLKVNIINNNLRKILKHKTRA